MMIQPNIIQGGQHSDGRGILNYVNDFDMDPVKRMYMISHPDTHIRRGWRGHRLEQRWFQVIIGAFEVLLAKIDDWDNPSSDVELERYTLSDNDSQVLHVPTGYASCFRALEPGSKLMVYADAYITDAKHDDYQYPTNYFSNLK